MKPVSGARIAGGAAWMMAARVADRFVGVASTMILARLLVPEDFGLVAMAVAVISLIELAGAFGFEIPLIRASNPGRDQYDTVWTLNLLFGLFCGVLIVATAFPAAAFYKDDRLIGVMWWLAAGCLIGSIANVGIVDFRRNLDFAWEFRFLMATRIATFAVTIPCALYFRSYWALIAGMVTGRIVSATLSYLWHPYRPRLCLRALRELFAFSVWIFVDKIAGFANSRIPDFFLGRLHGPAAVGTYRMGEEIGHIPGTELIAPINRALLPGAFRLAEGGREFSDIAVKATGVVATLVAPACLGICAIADPVIRVMLGPKWLEAIPILQVIAVNALIAALWANQQTILLAAGHPRLPGLIGILRFFLLLPLVLMLVPENSGLGVAWSMLLSNVGAVGTGFAIGLKTLRVSLAGFLGAIWRPIAAGIAMFFLVTAIVDRAAGAAGPSNSILVLLVCVGAGVVSFTVTLFVLYLIAGRPQGAERLILERLHAMRASRRSRSENISNN